MKLRVAIAYNEPESDRYQAMGESKAIIGVLDEVRAVHNALVELGFPAILVPLSPPLENVREKLQNVEADLIFNLFEGFAGSPETEAQVADIIAATGLPYTGCPGRVLALALDKAKTKQLLEKAGIGTPRYQVLNPANLAGFNLIYPCIIKPLGEDASHGLSDESIVSDFVSLEKQVKKISGLFGGKALVEEFLDGREFNITVMGNRKPVALPVSEIVYTLPPGVPKILTFAAKWEEDSIYYKGTNNVCPAPISEKKRKEISRIAVAVFKLLDCQGYARVDFRADSAGNPRVLEINPNPDISSTSGAARQVQVAGMIYSQFIENILQLALERD